MPLLKRNPIYATIVSILVAIGIYGLIFGIPLATGFVLLILVHELGHLLMLKYLGYRAAPPIFIPFVGALIGMQDRPINAQAEALVAYAGPFLGTVGAYLVYLLYRFTGVELFLLLAFIGFLINLFNLIPVSPLDGGRIVTAISRWLWLPGLLSLLILFFQIGNPLILLIAGIGLQRTYQSLFKPEELEKSGYFNVNPFIRLVITLAYAGLVLFLGHLTLVTYYQLQ